LQYSRQRLKEMQRSLFSHSQEMQQA